MPKAVWNKAEKVAETVAEKADPIADSLLDKIKNSKWSALILAGAVGVALLLLFN